MPEKIHVPGIPDQEFIRGSVPMTKEEIRALTLCKAKIQPGHIVYDIGAGTGSISAEAALMACTGKVFAVERDCEAIDLINQNVRKFNLNNVVVVHGRAPQALADLPAADVIIIGGSGGVLGEILIACDGKLSAGGKMIVNAVTLETLCKTRDYFLTVPHYDVDYTCLSVTKVQPAGSSHLFRAHNPVYVITASKG